MDRERLSWGSQERLGAAPALGAAPGLAAQRIRVMIVEDQALLADALARLISLETDLEVVASVSCVGEAIESSRRLLPDVVVMDFSLPDGDGTTAARAIKKGREETQVVMVTGFADPALLEAAMEAGCCGFLTKNRAARDVVSAVRRAYHGEAVIEPTLLASLLARRRRGSAAARAQLTGRELEVLVLLSQGISNRDIAQRLVLSVHTVRSHIQNLTTKLGAHSKLEAVAKAVRQGLISQS